MGGFSERRQAMTDAAFRTFGEDCLFGPDEQAVTVRIKSKEDAQEMPVLRAQVTTRMAAFRSWELPSIRDGDAFRVTSGRFAGDYEVLGDPEQDARGVWWAQFASAQ